MLSLYNNDNTVKPLNVDIISLSGNKSASEFEENERVKFSCRSSGSSPPASLRWQMTKRDATDELASFSFIEAKKNSDQSISESSIEFQLTWQHHLAELTCTATNERLPPELAGRSISTSLKLNVKCKYVEVVLSSAGKSRH